MKCEICNNEFQKIEEIFLHPVSFLKPRLVHRKCMHPLYRMQSWFSVKSSIEWFAPIFVIFIVAAIILAIYVHPFFLIAGILLLAIQITIYIHTVNAYRSFKK